VAVKGVRPVGKAVQVEVRRAAKAVPAAVRAGQAVAKAEPGVARVARAAVRKVVLVGAKVAQAEVKADRVVVRAAPAAARKAVKAAGVSRVVPAGRRVARVVPGAVGVAPAVESPRRGETKEVAHVGFRGTRRRNRAGTSGGGNLRRAMIAGAGTLAMRWWRNRQASHRVAHPSEPASSGERPIGLVRVSLKHS
jgi:hypothetical protein